MSQTYDAYEDWEEEAKDSPIALVGMLVMMLTSFAIIANALLNQPISAEIEMINQAEKHKSAQTTLHRKTGSVQSSATPPVHSDHAAMTLAIQRQLTMAGYYVGPLDGAEGTQTREAILAYQDAAGMPATGRVSLELHDILTGRKSYTPDNAIATSSIRVDGDLQVAAHQTPSAVALPVLPRGKPDDLAADRGGSSRKQVALPVPSRLQTRGAASDIARTNDVANNGVATGPVPPEAIPAPSADPVLKKVQSALTRFGYGNLSVDGLMGSQTRAAISAFQRSRGHPVTGTINDRLLQEMMIMGYLDLG